MCNLLMECSSIDWDETHRNCKLRQRMIMRGSRFPLQPSKGMYYKHAYAFSFGVSAPLAFDEYDRIRQRSSNLVGLFSEWTRADTSFVGTLDGAMAMHVDIPTYEPVVEDGPSPSAPLPPLLPPPPRSPLPPPPPFDVSWTKSSIARAARREQRLAIDVKLTSARQLMKTTIISTRLTLRTAWTTSTRC